MLAGVLETQQCQQSPTQWKLEAMVSVGCSPTLFSLQRHGRHQGKGTKYSEKAFKSKLNPINDSFKRSILSIYKSTLLGLCAICLLTFAVSQSTVQAPWALTPSANSSLPGISIRKILQCWLWFNLHLGQPRSLPQVQWAHSWETQLLLMELIFMANCSTCL